MSKNIVVFCVKLILSLSVVFAFHLAILHFLDFPLFENQLIMSYSINGILAIIIFITLYKLRVKYLDLLGFIFMAGSFLKFGVYFVLFRPIFKQDGDVTALEATSFLAPYLLCLIIETFYLIKMLNNKL
ncbi:MAG: hypothetical protein GQ540_10070 [Lutibacter sp.]|uniref:hypothetical protein n=1 Tax=Lutibacter sp. TaxID=1925666 RepID=UPI0019EAAB17|nr:hypothetical protein [Lutibacter sp.]NOR28856.1 hypothetical protein [Lutibacter sp.]